MLPSVKPNKFNRTKAILMNKFRFIILGVVLACSTMLHAQQYFAAFEGKTAPSSGKQFLVPDQYKIYTAGNDALQSYLHGLTSEPTTGQTLQLPTPEGTFRIFKIWKSSMMEESLQAKYSNIETFTAVALDNNQVTAKIDFTANGFHAMVFDGSHTFLVDPYTDAHDGYYLVYYKKDYHRIAGNYMSCGVQDNEIRDAAGNHAEVMDGTLPHLAAKQFGTTQRVYRLALSCTGEYAQAVGGSTPTKMSVFSAMTTSMNRVNGIYEREFAISMTFIANEDTLIYLNPNTDPFTANNNGGALLGQNATNTGMLIDSTHYDIGHIFSTGGGGIAEQGSVCQNSGNLKAQGVTGSLNPVGDAYDVDYVAHEMGHQYGASHSFNSQMGACGGGNAVQNHAYEPGSGSTIMAYAGICGSDDLQPHSDAYFHATNMDEITDYVTASATTCAVTHVGVAAPVLPAIADTFYIPVGTAFELTAPIATSDSTDTLTYCWEQWNLGNFETAETLADTFHKGPCFRSFDPVLSRVRVFPQISSVLQSDFSDLGERLPTVSRALDFKVTARSVYNGFGTFNFSNDQLRVNVVDSIGPFVVTGNITTDSIKVQTQGTVTWNVAHTTQAPVSTPNVDIFLSVDGGYTYPYTLATAVPNNGSAVVTMPNVVTSNGRIKVKGSGNVFFAISDNNFKIYSDVLSVHDVQLNNSVSVYPNPARDMIHIRNSAGNKLTLELFNVLGQTIWSGTMKQTGVVPVGGLSRGVYYLQLKDENTGGKTVKPVTLQ
jgi:hypothetical protein